MKKMSYTIVSVVVLSLVIIFTQAQVFDVYGLYTNNRTILFDYGEFCYCDNLCSTGAINSSVIGVTEIPINRFYNIYDDKYNFMIKVETCDSVRIITDHINTIRYSFDNINWSNKLDGYAMICPKIGYLFVNITSNLNLGYIKFKVTNMTNCPNVTISSNNTLLNYTIDGPYMVNISYRTYAVSLYVYSDTPGCDLSTYTHYWGPNNMDNYNYSMGSTFTYNFAAIGTYYQEIYINPVGIKKCNISIIFSSLVGRDIYTRDVVFYNGVQVYDYIKLNQTYDMYWNGLIPINLGLGGSLSGYPIGPKVLNLNNSQVYSIVDMLGNYSYFQPLLVFYGIYTNLNITIDDTYTFNNNIFINDSFINLNITNVPVIIDIQYSTLNILNNVTIYAINFTGYNLLCLNNSITILTTANFSGNLSLYIPSNYTGNVTIIKYNNSIGEFDHIIVNGINNCTKYKSNYLKSELIITFEIKDSCVQNDKKEDNMILYIALGIVVFLVLSGIIITIIILKVRYFHERVFPHRNRTFYQRQIIDYNKSTIATDNTGNTIPNQITPKRSDYT